MTKEEGRAETERMIEGEREKGRDRQTDRQRRERGGKREGEGEGGGGERERESSIFCLVSFRVCILITLCFLL